MQPTKTTSTVRTTEPANNRNNTLVVVLSVLLALSLLALGWFAYQWTEERDRANRLDTEVKELKEAQQAPQIIPAEPEEPVDGSTAKDDTEAILDAAKAYEAAKPENTGVELKYTIDKREGDFALVNVSVANGGGHAQILKKTDNKWEVILAGQQFETADLDRLEVPAALR